MGLGNIFGNYLRRVCLHEYTMAALLKGMIDIVPENSFSCMISKFLIVIFLFIYPKMC